MKQTQIIMGMPITVEIAHSQDRHLFQSIFAFFRQVDERYSTYKENSEITQVNGGLPRSKWSIEMKEIMRLCEETKQETNGYFDIEHEGRLDPSGLVKGWSIWQAAQDLIKQGAVDFYIEAGGDIQAHGTSQSGQGWVVGIRNPFNTSEIIQTLCLHDQGIATSGTYIRGQHIYNPYSPKDLLTDVQSLTVIAPNVYEADRFATAAFAMGTKGIAFIEKQDSLEGYMVDAQGVATYTSGFKGYVNV